MSNQRSIWGPWWAYAIVLPILFACWYGAWQLNIALEETTGVSRWAWLLFW